MELVMSICYSDDASAGQSKAPYEFWKACDRYLEHYANMLLLSFLADKSKDGVERAQARKELDIANKKMSYWKTHPNYDQKTVTSGIEKLKRDWK